MQGTECCGVQKLCVTLTDRYNILKTLKIQVPRSNTTRRSIYVRLFTIFSHVGSMKSSSCSLHCAAFRGAQGSRQQERNDTPQTVIYYVVVIDAFGEGGVQTRRADSLSWSECIQVKWDHKSGPRLTSEWSRRCDRRHNNLLPAAARFN